MKDADCIAFLQRVLPELNLRWSGFRKVRRQVCKRLARRMAALGLASIDDYQARLNHDPEEWHVLDAACQITISRFYRDRQVFDVLGETVLPLLARAARNESRPVRIWSAGCASGEEVYTLAILWDEMVRTDVPDVPCEIIGTDADPVMIDRARKGCYARGSLKDAPAAWLERAFERRGTDYCVPERYRRHVTLRLQDIRDEQPAGLFDLILCRNLAFTYFALPLQNAVLDAIRSTLRSGGFLVIGGHEALPQPRHDFEAYSGPRAIFRQIALPASSNGR